ncbi:hypothetical protein I3843_06G026700 [Carya illinoinensis]|uniref:Uncharacterized protein n=1 Tax=Carya illinoinensis TaxID=32201 RepID=A0A8T1Q763_CARIL|nr:uncharacterized protein LOC122313883 [Carya illinoinensis]KAG6650238.1 hypothetical protein CIPAW_06G028500 [Carya illinoinensis]KAG6707369.1 hypothetical protein I3842_06G027800 [Carya illinoinensis]KAG7974036.1 hypothetical protein I3843_06G026700 [Carya illinoinensis]
MNPGPDDKPTNSVTYKNLEIKVPSIVLEVSVKEKTNGEDDIFNPEDDKYKVIAKAKKILESYDIQEMKNVVKDKNLGPALKKEIEIAIDHLNKWLEYVKNPQTNEKEIKKYLKKNKQEIYDPIVKKIKQFKQSSSST